MSKRVTERFTKTGLERERVREGELEREKNRKRGAE